MWIRYPCGRAGKGTKIKSGTGFARTSAVGRRCLLQLVDHVGDAREDLFHRTRAVDRGVFALGGIVVRDDGGLLAVDVEAAADHLLGGVVGASRILAAEQDALDEFLLGDVDVDHDVDLEPVPGKELVELLGLYRGAGEAVEDAALDVLVL